MSKFLRIAMLVVMFSVVSMSALVQALLGCILIVIANCATDYAKMFSLVGSVLLLSAITCVCLGELLLVIFRSHTKKSDQVVDFKE